jgi:hypothetical protein
MYKTLNSMIKNKFTIYTCTCISESRLSILKYSLYSREQVACSSQNLANKVQCILYERHRVIKYKNTDNNVFKHNGFYVNLVYRYITSLSQCLLGVNSSAPER